MKEKPKDITFHYTNEQMVKDLIAITPLTGSVLDAGSGKNKVWYKNIPDGLEKYECEIEDGCDFMEWDKKVNWIIGNPPFNIGWKFIEKSCEIAQTGIAVLGNINNFNQFTPKRLHKMKEKGFTLNHIKIVADKRWFGRYYYLIFTKNNNNLLSWERKTY
ncbi:MAG TPA: hypothetical protein PKN54_03330 [Candidatus Cloacimonas acidaminovorans]|nr:hypothetical protein [Candidatus Cloacimonas acidaminovorans]